MAIFEFLSSNGFSTFTLNFECRHVKIEEIRHGNQSYFSSLVVLPFYFRSDKLCEERGYKISGGDCTFQGKKCSMINFCL